MADSLTIDVDARAVLAAFAALPDGMHRHLMPAALISATSIKREAGARVARRTGQTAAGITIEETHKGDGYVIFVRRPGQPGLPGWLEFGTQHMTKRPFLFVSAILEEGPHDRRVREAMQTAIDEQGVGE